MILQELIVPLMCIYYLHDPDLSQLELILFILLQYKTAGKLLYVDKTV